MASITSLIPERLLRRSQLWNFLQWSSSRAAPEPGEVFLSQRRVYVLPTRHGHVFFIALVLMLVGSINYNLALGYVLTFLLAGMGTVCILHTVRNLAHLHVSAGRAGAVYAGDRVLFRVHVENRTRSARHAIRLLCEDAQAWIEVPAGSGTDGDLAIVAAQRGWMQLPRVTLETRFPLGLLRAWSYVRPDVRALVYPRPDDGALPPPQPQPDTGEHLAAGAGTDDYAGLRTYQASDSPRHMAWKAIARSEDLLTKQFSGRTASELWLDWDALDGMDTEARLSRLARWVLLASQRGLRFGLKLPGLEVPLDEGAAQRDLCLRELALYGRA